MPHWIKNEKEAHKIKAAKVDDQLLLCASAESLQLQVYKSFVVDTSWHMFPHVLALIGYDCN